MEAPPWWITSLHSTWPFIWLAGATENSRTALPAGSSHPLSASGFPYSAMSTACSINIAEMTNYQQPTLSPMPSPTPPSCPAQSPPQLNYTSLYHWNHPPPTTSLIQNPTHTTFLKEKARRGGRMRSQRWAQRKINHAPPPQKYYNFFANKNNHKPAPDARAPTPNSQNGGLPYLEVRETGLY